MLRSGVIVFAVLGSVGAQAAPCFPYTCRSMDPTFYPKYEINVGVMREAVNNGQFHTVVLGTKTETVDFKVFTTTQLWGLAEETHSRVPNVRSFFWDSNPRDGQSPGRLVLTYLSNGYLKGELYPEGSNVAAELQCTAPHPHRWPNSC